jgi:GTP:adenosylcobinamide-phosphate guanylyltransferase
VLKFFKQLGSHCKKTIQKMSKKIPTAKNTVDAAYVLYVLSSGQVDDLQECMQTI